jgi:SET domain-containing protein
MDCAGDIRYTNHSCDPNCVMVVSEERCYLVAIRDLAQGETVTFDYNTTGVCV